MDNPLNNENNPAVMNTANELQPTKEQLLEERKRFLIQEKKRKEEEERNARKEKALKSMQYLLAVSEKLSNFVKQQIIAAEKGKRAKKRDKSLPTMEEALVSEDQKNKIMDISDITEHLKYFTGTLKPYQIEGVTWLVRLYQNAVNGILADEMGLGKTVQVIALICHLIEKNNPGPFLIVVPLSTLSNWKSEFERFAPKIPVVVFYGNQDTRRDLYTDVLTTYRVDNLKVKPVVLTSFQTPGYELKFLTRWTWQYVVVDEGHRIKNHESKLSLQLKCLKSNNRLILTGTPLQNNLTELWALLNFLLPQIFRDMDSFASLLAAEDFEDNSLSEKSTNIISTIHRVLAPFMLRRLKSDVLIDMVPKKEVQVYCPMTRLQKDLYKYTIEKNIAKLKGIADDDDEEEIIDYSQPKQKRKCTVNRKYFDEDGYNENFEEVTKIYAEKQATPTKEIKSFGTRITIQNPMMMFKKIVDHPYLVNFPLDPLNPTCLLIDEKIITSSGKMMVLDAMLARLRKDGHKVLIFSTLVMFLDLIEDMMEIRGYTYRRLDGRHSLADREQYIKEFNTKKDILAFLISTRAGGLGINLTGADTVIFVDRDWNPQVDIQAQDRCHRIGQTKPVMIYTLVTKNTIDEKILKCSAMKRRLEKVVIKDGKFKSLNSEDKKDSEQELRELQELLNLINSSNECVFTDADLEAILDRSELYKEMGQKADIHK